MGVRMSVCNLLGFYVWNVLVLLRCVEYSILYVKPFVSLRILVLDDLVNF